MVLETSWCLVEAVRCLRLPAGEKPLSVSHRPRSYPSATEIAQSPQGEEKSVASAVSSEEAVGGASRFRSGSCSVGHERQWSWSIGKVHRALRPTDPLPKRYSTLRYCYHPALLLPPLDDRHGHGDEEDVCGGGPWAQGLQVFPGNLADDVRVRRGPGSQPRDGQPRRGHCPQSAYRACELLYTLYAG